MKLSIVGFCLGILLTASSTYAAPTCLPGDRSVGPNCIRVRKMPPTEFSANADAILVSWVYRLANGVPSTVWQGLGQVEASTHEKLRIHVRFTPKPSEDGEPQGLVDYAYDIFWTGKTYSRRGF